ncbi:hypothetical protein AQUSIP_02890 [Aquicella siphonis]|uniref:Uncharacterized protein n=1 Tax=Aquicella siphonis TaxID=254247 RepID=A0A5E4PEI3_9COXI|nr:hypothetical protein [Aquicella siphonis]VVC75015.1 hypothetical protein AQUSIP_02890 [Aquicella siphonis]
MDKPLYKGYSFEPASEKSLNGKYFPRGQIVRQTTDGEGKVLKTFDGEYLTKSAADSAFIELAKKYIDNLVKS